MRIFNPPIRRPPVLTLKRDPLETPNEEQRLADLYLQRLPNSCACAGVRPKGQGSVRAKFTQISCALFAGSEKHFLRKRGQNKPQWAWIVLWFYLSLLTYFPQRWTKLKAAESPVTWNKLPCVRRRTASWKWDIFSGWSWRISSPTRENTLLDRSNVLQLSSDLMDAVGNTSLPSFIASNPFPKVFLYMLVMTIYPLRDYRQCSIRSTIIHGITGRGGPYCCSDHGVREINSRSLISTGSSLSFVITNLIIG